MAAAGSGVGDAAVTAVAGLPSLPAGDETAAPAAKAAAAAAASFWAICAYEKRVPLLSCSQKNNLLEVFSNHFKTIFFWQHSMTNGK